MNLINKSKNSTIGNIMKNDKDIINEALRIINEQNSNLPENVYNAFINVAEQQRGEPERIMVKIQHAMGGGVLNPVVEHSGDLIHRMTERTALETGTYGYEFVNEKVEKVYKILSQEYGFIKEMNENMRNNAESKGIDWIDLKLKVNDLLDGYAQEHSKLKTYNHVQNLANEIAINIGKKEFKRATDLLSSLRQFLKDEDTWIKHASMYYLDDNGEILEYKNAF